MSGGGEIEVRNEKCQHHERAHGVEERDPLQRQKPAHTPRSPITVEQIEPTRQPQQRADQQQHAEVGDTL